MNTKERQSLRILQFLEVEGECSETKISNITGIAYYVCQRLLRDMEEEGKLVRRGKNRYTYWKIPEQQEILQK